MMDSAQTPGPFVVNRRRLLTRGVGLVAAGGGLATFVAACGGDDSEGSGGAPGTTTAAPGEGEATVGDVLDFALDSDEWEGAFGFVSMRLHAGIADGEKVWFIRTDASDEAFARREQLVFAPKLSALANERLSGELFVFDDGPAVLSSRPGGDEYTPAWRVFEASWQAEPRDLRSPADVRSAEARGELTVKHTRRNSSSTSASPAPAIS